MKNLNLYLIVSFLALGCQNVAAMGDEKSAMAEVESVKPAGLDEMGQHFLGERLLCCGLRHTKDLTKESKDELARDSNCGGYSDVNEGWADCKSYADCKKRHSDIVTCAGRVLTSSTARPFDRDRIDIEMTRCIDDLTNQRKTQSMVQSMWDPRVIPYTKCVAGLNEKIFAIAKKQLLRDLTLSQRKEMAAGFDKCSAKLTTDKR